MERLVLLSSGRVTVITSASRVNATAPGISRERVPFGPVTETVRPSMVTFTPAGTAMGLRPIRDISPLLYQT